MRSSSHKTQSILNQFFLDFSKKLNTTFIIWNEKREIVQTYAGIQELNIFANNSTSIDKIHADDLHKALFCRVFGIGSLHNFEESFRVRLPNNSYIKIKVVNFIGASRSYAGTIIQNIDIETQIESEYQEIAKKLQDSQIFDSITKLNSRSYLVSAIREKLTVVDNPLVLFLIDIDNFQRVNNISAETGDKTLAIIGKILRDMFPSNWIISRQAADEFVVTADIIATDSELLLIAKEIQKRLQKKITVDDHKFFLNASIAIINKNNLKHTQKLSPESILDRASLTIDKIKQTQKGNIEIFDPNTHIKCNSLNLETDIREAIENDEFEVFYQPIVNLQTGVLAGFEALLRWFHPQKGEISPIEFIPVAENSNLIVPLGNWLLTRCFEQTKLWTQNYQVSSDFRIAINISVQQLSNPNFVDTVTKMLSEINLKGKYVKFEITESLLIDNFNKIISTIEYLKQYDIQFSLDDFGTGNSSLNYISTLPIDTLKIDKSFVDHIVTDSKSYAFLRLIVLIGEIFDLSVVTEGIEHAKQLNRVKDLNCLYGQGYYFGKPLNTDLAQKLIVKNQII